MRASIDITEADDENDWPTPISEENDERMSISIADKLNLVTNRSEKSFVEIKYYSSIARVPKHLRDVNEKSYEPQIIAIGPYHRHPHIKPHLEVMEEHKVRYLKMLLRRKGEDNVKRYVKTMRKLEERARACYADVVKLNEYDFVEMLLLDACFIVELFRKFGRSLDMGTTSTANGDDPVIDSYWIKQKLRRDLLLVENQLPFFVLEKFFQMTAMQDEPKDFLGMIFSFFVSSLPNRSWTKDIRCSNAKEIKHLLSFVHDHWASPVVPTVIYRNEEKKITKFKKAKLVIEKLKRAKSNIAGAIRSRKKMYNWEFIRCAAELKEAGIKFMMVERENLFDIKFEGGIIKIPRLKIEDDTESFFRNLIVYEQSHPKVFVIVDYIKLMDCLINSAKDVELLCQRKILHNCLGDDEVVANMFNRLCDSVTLSSSNYYEDIYLNVNKHCSRRQNKWMANLRHNYFNTPWALVSFIAAALLLLLTAIQTVFTIVAYFHHGH